MSSRARLFAIPAPLLVVPLAFGGEPEPPVVHESQPAAVATEPAPIEAGGLRLRNAGNGAVRVEVSVVRGPDCAGKATVVIDRTVLPGRTWLIRSSQALCLRREKVEPDGRRQTEPWQRKESVPGRIEEVTL